VWLRESYSKTIAPVLSSMDADQLSDLLDPVAAMRQARQDEEEQKP
jgi:hypothetical protein